jgi:hypothetical protein
MTRRQPMVDDLDEDIRDHITRETEDNIARGMSPKDAHSAALRTFGNVLRVKEDSRAVWISVWLEQLVQDVRFALRLLRTTPGFTIAAVLTLALAIGANALVFAVFNVFVVHPLDFAAEPVHARTRVADLNAIGADLERRFPKDDGQMTFTLARPALGLSKISQPVQAFLGGLMHVTTTGR